jgi:hypothetical protein
MMTDMWTAPGSHDHQPKTLGFMPWMPARVRARRVGASVPTAPPTKDSPERTEPVLRGDQMLDLVDLARRVESA